MRFRRIRRRLPWHKSECGTFRECARLFRSSRASSPTKRCSGSTMKWTGSIGRLRRSPRSFSRPQDWSNRMKPDNAVRDHVVKLLAGGQAHATFEAAVKGIPAPLRGKRPKGAEHSPWEILEHMRIAQWDILEFSRDAKHVSPEWPAGYWPKSAAPPNDRAWGKSVRDFTADLDAMRKLVADESTDLYAPIPHGEGQTILREALLMADHNAY